METEVKKQTVLGTSIINHNVRQKLGLSVSEYVMLSFLQEVYEDGIGLSEYVCWGSLGVSMETVNFGIEHLRKKNLIEATKFDGMWKPVESWYKAHKEKGFEFGLFWQPITIGSDMIQWRDSPKGSTKQKLSSRLREVPIEQLIYSKLRYFFSKWESKSFDYVMGSLVFLGPDKHYSIRYTLKPDTEQKLGEYIRQYYGSEGIINLMTFLTAQQQEMVVKKPIINDDYFNDNE